MGNVILPAILFLSTLCAAAGLHAQGTTDDYNRAYALRHKFSIANVDNATINPVWIGNTGRLWYIRDVDGHKEYTIADTKTRSKRRMFDHAALAGALGKATGKEIDAGRLYLERLRINDSADTLYFVLDGKHWSYATRKQSLKCAGEVQPQAPQPHWMVVDEEKQFPPVPSPDGTKTAYIRDCNVWVKDSRTGKETQLSNDGTQGNYYSAYIRWSPDGTKVATCKIRPAEKRYVYYVESSPADQLQPKLHRQEYAKPGDELRFKLPCVFDVDSRQAMIPDTRLFASQYDIYGPVWNPDSKGITFEYNERGHKVYRVLEMSAETAAVRTLIEETSDKYVNYPRHFRHDLSNGKRIIWMSERDNWNHLHMFDRETGAPLHRITQGPWYVREVIHVDEPGEKIYFSANGVNPDVDPYLIGYYSINFDGSDMKELTPGKGTHRAVFSPDMKYIADTYSSIDTPPVTEIRDAASGDLIMEVERADASRLMANGWTAPEVFTAPGRDNLTPMWGLIYRPTNFDPAKKYPIVEYIYQGPGDQYVPKSFTPYNHYMSSLAELGFIVVMVDGMGTSFRSREFESICYKNLDDAGLPDHIAWIKAAAKTYPYMDLDRVGIFGCSAGGQESTTALLNYPDFYKAAYSACGCHDNRMDKIWWNELWMGYPVDDAYRRASNVENAHKLQRPLMLVVGELDDNVDPASTMQVVNALIKANKDFELVVIPGAHHTMGEDFGEHKRYDFFVRHLHGTQPPAWDKLDYNAR